MVRIPTATPLGGKYRMDRQEKIRGAGSISILVVDDDEDIRVLLLLILSSMELEVTSAPDAAAAMAEMDATPFDILLTDVRMPGMDGLELADWANENHPSTDVIIMSGSASLEAAERAALMERIGYLAKPFANSETVKEAVRSILAKRGIG